SAVSHLRWTGRSGGIGFNKASATGIRNCNNDRISFFANQS
ncbi:unnamed protein product, partial [Adineta steineri]